MKIKLLKDLKTDRGDILKGTILDDVNHPLKNKNEYIVRCFHTYVSIPKVDCEIV